MALELLVGLYVTDDATYQQYREHMSPILEEHGGGFGYDFRVSEVLKSQTDAPINRVFTIHFPSQAVMDTFFANETYKAVKAEFYEPSVSHTSILKSYEQTGN